MSIQFPSWETPFNRAYWLSQPPEVQAVYALMGDPLKEKRGALVATLLVKGYKIDNWIMVEGMSPDTSMKLRAAYGLPWVPSALMAPIQLWPGIGQPGSVPYDPNHMPPDGIKVSLNPADYPPWPEPEPNHPSVSTVLVGAHVAANVYLTMPGDNSVAGTQYTDERGTFTKHMTATITGWSSYWTLDKPAGVITPVVQDPSIVAKPIDQ